MLRAREVHGEEGEKGKHQGAGYVAGKVGSSGEEGDDADDIAQQDEEEGREQIWRVAAVVVFAYVLAGHVVYHHYERLHQGRDAGGMLLEGVVALVPAGREQNDDYQQDGVEHELQHVLGDGDVEGLAAVLADNLSLVGGSFGGDVVSGIFTAFQDVAGVEGLYASVDEDDGEVDCHRFAFPFGYVPFIAVQYVFEDDVADVQVAFRGGRLCGRLCGRLFGNGTGSQKNARRHHCRHRLQTSINLQACCFRSQKNARGQQHTCQAEKYLPATFHSAQTFIISFSTITMPPCREKDSSCPALRQRTSPAERAEMMGA